MEADAGDKSPGGDVAHENALLRQKQGIPESLNVVCGGIRGVLLLDKGRVIHNGEEITPTEFERLGGRAAAKKWKQSVRVILPNGDEGGPVANWLQEHNISIGICRPGAAHASLRPVSRKPGSKGDFYGAPAPNLREHLEARCIGLLPGDPSAEALPDELPSDWGDCTVVDLREVSVEELAQLAADSAADPLAALLPTPPGVGEHRLAYFTGHQPSQPSSPADQAKARASLDSYLDGGAQAPPWESLGFARPPTIEGKELDLKGLWKEVQANGGYEACTASKQWASVATSLGFPGTASTNSSYLLREHYRRILLSKEGGEAATAAAPDDVKMTAAEGQIAEANRADGAWRGSPNVDGARGAPSNSL